MGVGQTVVSLVVVTYNSARVLPEFLAALPAALDGASAGDLVIVDNSSTDETRSLVSTLAPEARLVPLPDNRGYAAGLNAGIRTLPPDHAVLVLNPDIRLAPGCVSRLLDVASRPGVGIAVPRLLDAQGLLLPSLRREPTVLRALAPALVGDRLARLFPATSETVAGRLPYRVGGRADWATGAAMLVTAACRAAVGEWDESFFLYSEETDYALRARDAGFALELVPSAIATHLGGASTSSPHLWSRLMVNRVGLHRKRKGAIAAAGMRGALIIGSALRARRPRDRAALSALLKIGKGAGAAANPPYICFSAQDWWYHNRAHSDFQLMREVARERPVLLVNSIGMRMPMPGRSTMPWQRIARKAASVSRLLRTPVPEVPGFHVLTPLPLPLYGSPRGRALNARLVRGQVRAAARALRFVDPVIVATIPTAVDVVAGMRHRSLLYNRSDRHSAFPEVDGPSIAALEDRLLRDSDKVLYVSRALMAEEHPKTGERARFLDHGVDLEHFRRRGPEEEPEDLRHIPHPRIGFFGGFDDYIIDFDLLEKLARELDDAQLVLIGGATCSMRRLESLDNVHWLGYRPYELIPAYGSRFDVAIMPWLDNSWIRASNPIKLKEYLALELPVVTMPFEEAHHWSAFLDIAADSSDFVERVRQRLGTPLSAPERTARREAVEAYSWAARARLLMAWGEEA